MFHRQISYIRAILTLVLYCLHSKLRQERQTWQTEPVLICVGTPPAALNLKDYSGLVWITASWWLLSCLINSLPLSAIHVSSSRVSSILRESGPHFPSHEPLGSPCQQRSYLRAAPFLWHPKRWGMRWLKFNQTKIRHLNPIYTT